MKDRQSEINRSFKSKIHYDRLVKYISRDIEQRNFLLNNSIPTPQIYGTLKTTFSKSENLILVNNLAQVFNERLIYTTANKEFNNYDTASLQKFLKMNFGITSEIKNNPLEITENAQIEEQNFDNYIYKAFKYNFEKLLMFYLYYASNTGTAEEIKKLLNIEFSTTLMFQSIDNLSILEQNKKRVGTLLKRFFELSKLDIDANLIEHYLFDKKADEVNIKSSYNYKKIYNIYSWHKLNKLDKRTAEKLLNSGVLSIDGFLQHSELKELIRKLSKITTYKSKKDLYFTVSGFFNYANTFFNNETNIIFFMKSMFELEKNDKKQYKITAKKSLIEAIKLIK